MKRTASDGIAVWFWSRYDSTVPRAVQYGRPVIQPDITWGLPDAYFPFTEKCSANHFDAHQIIFDDTFCVRLALQYVVPVICVNLHYRGTLLVPYIPHQVVPKHARNVNLALESSSFLYADCQS